MAAAGEIEEEGRIERICSIMELAATTDKASNVRRAYINGNQMRIARDVVTLEDGTVLVTFICIDEHEFSTLDRKTEGISSAYGNTLPILSETKNERAQIQLLADLQVLWAIFQSGPFTMKTAKQYTLTAEEIIRALLECGALKQSEDVYTLER